MTLVAVLAGGRGRRLGEPKPLADLGGRPLVAWPLAAAAAAGLEAVVVAKAGTPLPAGVTAWQEPDAPVHPLAGVVFALERAGAPVLAVPCDMPWLPARLLMRLAGGPEAVLRAEGRLVPFPVRVGPPHLPALREALAGEAGVGRTLEALGLPTLDAATFGDPSRVLASVNTPAELTTARARVGG